MFWIISQSIADQKIMQVRNSNSHVENRRAATADLLIDHYALPCAICASIVGIKNAISFTQKFRICEIEKGVDHASK